MTTKRIPIEVNAASMVELKANLFRKREQLKQKKAAADNVGQVPRPKPKKPSLFAQQKKRIAEKKPTGEMDQKTREEIAQEEEALRKSRAKLEEKAALYEKMTRTKNGALNSETDDKEERYLVDFEKKQMNDVREERRRQMNKREEEVVAKEPIPAPSNPDEEWVDYVDGLGRTRSCLKKDLPKMMEKDKAAGIEPTDVPLSERTLMSEDMHRELLRQKWEAEEEEMAEKPVGPLHYQDIRHDEIRNHGVGYYQFSKDETERQQQLEELNRLRNQTLSQREKHEKIKMKRKAALEARLEKVKKRKMKAVDGGKGANEEKEEEEDEKEEEPLTPPAKPSQEPSPFMNESFIAAAISSIRKEVDEARGDEGSKPQGRHWDMFRHEDLEDERPDEFAPPQSYSPSAGSSRRASKPPLSWPPPPPPPLGFNLPPPPLFFPPPR